MKAVEFTSVRNRLEMSQNRLAKVLSTSPRSIQAYEQGWRNIPAHVERMVLYLLYQKLLGPKALSPCWKIKKCPNSWREHCPTWRFRAQGPCWVINGNFCEGRNAENWDDKMETCRSCQVFTCVMKDLKNDGG